ncbi:MAG TPA: hypothetical protein PKC21_08505 [Oligoflexia bacterium]|nr:hypothetical protein [Oligoflexia bacterium]HMR25380.1 hypothetical protein [Oligoflexia bacterium]
MSALLTLYACQPESIIQANPNLNSNIDQNTVLQKTDYIQAIRSVSVTLTGGYLPQDLGIDMAAFQSAIDKSQTKQNYDTAIDVLMESTAFEQSIREFFLGQLYANEDMTFIARRPAEVATQVFMQRLPMNAMFTTQNTVNENGVFIDYDQANHGGVQHTPYGARAGIFTEVHIAKELNHSGSHFPAVRDYAKWLLCDLVSADFPKHKKWQSHQLAEPWKTGAGCPACHNFMQPVRGAFHRYGPNGEWRNSISNDETWGSVPGQASEPHNQQGETESNPMAYYELFAGYGPVLQPKDLVEQTIENYPYEVDQCQTSRLLAFVFNMVKETAGEQWVQPYKFDKGFDDKDYLKQALALYQEKQGVGYDFINALLKNEQLFIVLLINGVKHEE